MGRRGLYQRHGRDVLHVWVGVVPGACSSLVVILELNNTVSIIISAVFAAAYTVAGGFYSVTYTDVLQLLCIALGLSISAPFAYYHDSVSRENLKSIDWLGKIEPMDSGVWIDNMLLLIFGGIPWQGYFQRILSMKSTGVAKGLSLGAFFGCLLMAIPSAFIGIIARGTDWSTVEGYNRNLTSADAGIVLPLSLRYLTPEWVSFFGLGAVSAAVMSSADSSILASSAMFSRNIYKLAIRPKASDRELLWVLRMAVIVVTTLATLTALTVSSVYYLSYLCSDLVYVVLFPQLFLVLFWSKGVNTYGCLACYAVGFTLRLLGGEEGLGIPAGIRYPFYDDVAKVQKFPFRTTAMLCAMFTHVIVSKLARYLFESRIIDPVRYDVLGAFYNLLHNAKKPMGMGAIARRKGNEDTNEILDFYRVGDPSSVSVISGGAANPTMDVVEKISSEGVAVNNASGVLANGVAKDLNKRLASPENARKEGRETPAADGEFIPVNDEISKF
ncbi:hypothetical protein J437_LFUL003667 [Ladona fulva]|uniref:High-affinity choline transporter 1 n=1 Tax=Ladona fulva TaxID=123851 RepID=A0A8K0K480_LADFU|nr:hypothetical protein J437_LFUL003667 [Ladona fulva]